MAKTIHKEAIFWGNELAECGIPNTSPFEGTISEDTIIILSICNYVEVAGSNSVVLSGYPPNPESGEPNPSIDYNKLSQIITSNKNKGRIAPGDIAIFQELTRNRHAYFTAYRSFFKSDNTLRDLFTEKCQLLKRRQAISQNPNWVTSESGWDMCRRFEINGRNYAVEMETHAARLREVTACTARLAKSKHEAASVFQKIQGTRAASQHQRQKPSDNMNTTTKIHNGNGRIGPMKMSTSPMAQPQPQPQTAKRIESNGISKKRRIYPFQPPGLAVNKTTRKHQNACIAADRLNKGFGCYVTHPYHTPLPTPLTPPTLKTSKAISTSSVFLAGPGETTPPNSSPLRPATEEY
ncbi:hypothetical protein GX51_06268 [Blastomyces parvus]|uniref:Uncharacterized protein n=1 Tax=Blastomyces parvus TaxID=2060905 RepID=A0A2B7WSH7_9EURO|nr:hypothetical protein GX51_06268 [Blastomyces parvus]